MLHKLDDLEALIIQINLQNKNKIVHIIALTEVRLHEQQTPFFNLEQYNSHFCTRHDGYGGCALLMHESLSSNIINKKISFQYRIAYSSYSGIWHKHYRCLQTTNGAQ